VAFAPVGSKEKHQQESSSAPACAYVLDADGSGARSAKPYSVSWVEEHGMGALVVFLKEHAFELLQMAKACTDRSTAAKLRALSAIVEEQARYCERKMATD
jgi:hypothetical protein